MRRLTLLLLAVGTVAAAAAAPASAESIEFEYLQGDAVTLEQLECSSTGASTATFSITGSAGGPYPGTFESSLTLIAGPVVFGEARLMEMSETFEIVSGDTFVTGTKHLTPFLPEDVFHPFFCSVTPSSECEEVRVSASGSGDALRYQATIDGPEGTQQEQGYAEFQITVDALRCGGQTQVTSASLDQFFARAIPPQEPAAVVLSPETAVNTVDSFHELTATVTDESGEPVDGAIVRFDVTGTSSDRGLCIAGAGECTFSYQVAPFPGTDTITAYVDVNANGMKDAGEPEGTATKTIVLPASTPGRTTGEGQFARNFPGGTVTFELTARSDGSTLRGGCTIVDKTSDTKIKCLDVLAYVQHGNEATIFGRAEQNGVPTLYRIRVSDGGSSGVADTISVTTAAGYFAFGQLTAGNIQVR
jgi:hypothetical protein